MNLNTTIHNAITEGKDWKFIKRLIDNGKGSLNDVDRKGRLPIHMAVKMNRVDLIKRLLPRNDVRDTKGFSPLSVAVKRGHLDCVIKILSINNQNIEKLVEGPSRETLLHMAIRKSQAQMLKFLVTRYIVQSQQLFDIRNIDGHTPISLAAHLQAFSEIRYLIDHGDNIESIKNKKFMNLYKDLLNSDQQKSVQNPYLFFPEGLIFMGGGAKGIIYNGVVKALDEENMLAFVKRVAGSSAGAITATLLALGCNAIEFNKIVENTAGDEFLESSTSAGGWWSGDKFLNWMEDLISKKTGIKHCTFGELRRLVESGKPFKHLHIYATPTSNMFDKVKIDSENEHFDDFIISHAVRASMAHPLFFAPHPLIRKRTIDGTIRYVTEKGFGSSDYSKTLSYAIKNEHLYSDGGIRYHNFPICAFDEDKYGARQYVNHDDFNGRVLGFSIHSKKQLKNIKANRENLSTTPPFPPITPKGLVNPNFIVASKKLKKIKNGQMNSYNIAGTCIRALWGNKTYLHQGIKDYGNHPVNDKRNVRLDNCGIGTGAFKETNASDGLGKKGIKTNYKITKNFLKNRKAGLGVLLNLVGHANNHIPINARPIKIEASTSCQSNESSFTEDTAEISLLGPILGGKEYIENYSKNKNEDLVKGIEHLGEEYDFRVISGKNGNCGYRAFGAALLFSLGGEKYNFFVKTSQIDKKIKELRSKYCVNKDKEILSNLRKFRKEIIHQLYNIVTEINTAEALCSSSQESEGLVSALRFFAYAIVKGNMRTDPSYKAVINSQIKSGGFNLDLIKTSKPADSIELTALKEFFQIPEINLISANAVGKAIRRKTTLPEIQGKYCLLNMSPDDRIGHYDLAIKNPGVSRERFSKENFKLFVCGNFPNIIPIETSIYDTMADIELKIEAKTGIPPEDQNLRYGPNELNTKDVRDYQLHEHPYYIAEESTVYLTIKM